MLTAIPKHWFSWDFTVMEGSQIVAVIDTSCWREKGVLRVQGVEYRVYRERSMGGAFVLASAGSVLARAVKPSAFRRQLTIEHEGKRYQLAAQSAFGRTFVLSDGRHPLGTLAPEGVFVRRARVTLPATLPLPVRVFLIWLVVILWRRASDATAVAST